MTKQTLIMTNREQKNASWSNSRNLSIYWILGRWLDGICVSTLNFETRDLSSNLAEIFFCHLLLFDVVD